MVSTYWCGNRRNRMAPLILIISWPSGTDSGIRGSPASNVPDHHLDQVDNTEGLQVDGAQHRFRIS